MDPPYQGVSGTRDQRYLPKVDHSQFCDELAELAARDVMFAVSYDGRTGEDRFGLHLPDSLGLVRLEVCGGRSTQATLLGRNEMTYESLYLSPALGVGAQPLLPAAPVANRRGHPTIAPSHRFSAAN